jgi:hypothetical protein
MSRDDKGNWSFTLKDLGSILGFIIGCCTLVGLIGGAYWVKFQVEQQQIDLAKLAARQTSDVAEIKSVLHDDHQAFKSHELKDNAQDVVLSTVLSELKHISATLDDMRAQQRTPITR